MTDPPKLTINGGPPKSEPGRGNWFSATFPDVKDVQYEHFANGTGATKHMIEAMFAKIENEVKERRENIGEGGALLMHNQEIKNLMNDILTQYHEVVENVPKDWVEAWITTIICEALDEWWMKDRNDAKENSPADKSSAVEDKLSSVAAEKMPMEAPLLISQMRFRLSIMDSEHMGEIDSAFINPKSCVPSGENPNVIANIQENLFRGAWEDAINVSAPKENHLLMIHGRLGYTHKAVFRPIATQRTLEVAIQKLFQARERDNVLEFTFIMENQEQKRNRIAAQEAQVRVRQRLKEEKEKQKRKGITEDKTTKHNAEVERQGERYKKVNTLSQPQAESSRTAVGRVLPASQATRKLPPSSYQPIRSASTSRPDRVTRIASPSNALFKKDLEAIRMTAEEAPKPKPRPAYIVQPPSYFSESAPSSPEINKIPILKRISRAISGKQKVVSQPSSPASLSSGKSRKRLSKIAAKALPQGASDNRLSIKKLFGKTVEVELSTPAPSKYEEKQSQFAGSFKQIDQLEYVRGDDRDGEELLPVVEEEDSDEDLLILDDYEKTGLTPDNSEYLPAQLLALQAAKGLNQMIDPQRPNESGTSRWRKAAAMFQVNWRHTGTDHPIILAGLKSKLYQYQAFGVWWQMTQSRRYGGGFVGDEMGLGKTLTFLAYIVAERQLSWLWSEVRRSRQNRDKKHLLASEYGRECPTTATRPGWITCPCFTNSPTANFSPQLGIRLALVPPPLISSWIKQWDDHIDESDATLGMRLAVAHPPVFQNRASGQLGLRDARSARNITYMKADKITESRSTPLVQTDVPQQNQERFLLLTTSQYYNSFIPKAFGYETKANSKNGLKTVKNAGIVVGIAVMDECHEDYIKGRNRCKIIDEIQAGPNNVPWIWGYSGSPLSNSPRNLEGVLWAIENHTPKTLIPGTAREFRTQWELSPELFPFTYTELDRLAKDFEHGKRNPLDINLPGRLLPFLYHFMIRRTAESSWFGAPLIKLKPHKHSDTMLEHNPLYDSQIQKYHDTVITRQMDEFGLKHDLTFNICARIAANARIFQTIPYLVRFAALPVGHTNRLTFSKEEVRRWSGKEERRSPLYRELRGIVESSAKIKWLGQFLDAFLEEDRGLVKGGPGGRPRPEREMKLIIISQFDVVAWVVRMFIEKYIPIHVDRIGLVTSATTPRDRTAILESFIDKNDVGEGRHLSAKQRGIKILIGTTRYIGQGLDLTRAQKIILMEPDISFARELQVYARVHRIGQKASHTESFRLVTESKGSRGRDGKGPYMGNDWEWEGRILDRGYERGEFVGRRLFERLPADNAYDYMRDYNNAVNRGNGSEDSLIPPTEKRYDELAELVEEISYRDWAKNQEGDQGGVGEELDVGPHNERVVYNTEPEEYQRISSQMNDAKLYGWSQAKLDQQETAQSMFEKDEADKAAEAAERLRKEKGQRRISQGQLGGVRDLKFVKQDWEGIEGGDEIRGEKGVSEKEEDEIVGGEENGEVNEEEGEEEDEKEPTEETQQDIEEHEPSNPPHSIESSSEESSDYEPSIPPLSETPPPSEEAEDYEPSFHTQPPSPANSQQSSSFKRDSPPRTSSLTSPQKAAQLELQNLEDQLATLQLRELNAEDAEVQAKTAAQEKLEELEDELAEGEARIEDYEEEAGGEEEDLYDMEGSQPIFSDEEIATKKKAIAKRDEERKRLIELAEKIETQRAFLSSLTVAEKDLATKIQKQRDLLVSLKRTSAELEKEEARSIKRRLRMRALERENEAMLELDFQDALEQSLVSKNKKLENSLREGEGRGRDVVTVAARVKAALLRGWLDRMNQRRSPKGGA